MAVTATPLSQIQRIASTEAERNTGWPEGSRVFCLDTLKMYILVSGVFQLIGPSPGGAVAITEVEIDVGATPVDYAIVPVTDAGISAISKIIGGVAYKAPTGKDLDELDEPLEVKFEALAGSLNVHIRSLEGYISDKFWVWYTFA